MKQIESKQQILFSATTISVTDPSKLINHCSLFKTVTECHRSIRKYCIHAVFAVVKPFDVDGPDVGRLKTDINGNMIASNLFNRFHRVLVNDVVQSSWWFQSFGDDASRFNKDLEWSLAYFENNKEPVLYSCVYGDIFWYNKESYGCLLLFKLICNETSTTKESNRRVMITIIKTYQIKTSCRGEVILMLLTFSVLLLIPCQLSMMIPFLKIMSNRSLLPSQQLVFLRLMNPSRNSVLISFLWSYKPQSTCRCYQQAYILKKMCKQLITYWSLFEQSTMISYGRGCEINVLTQHQGTKVFSLLLIQ